MQRNKLIIFLKENGVQAMFHYPGLHTSPFFISNNKSILPLKNAENFSDCLLRLPLYFELNQGDIDKIVNLLFQFYK